MPLVPGIYGGGWGPLLGENSQRPDSWQYQPTTTAHDPNPPLPIEAASGPSATAAGVFPAFRGAATGTKSYVGATAGAFPSLRGAATGTHTGVFTATAAGQFPSVIGAAIGVKSYQGAADGVFPSVTGGAVGTKSYAGVASGAFPAFTGSATGAKSYDSIASGAFPAFTGTATGEKSYTAAAAGTFPMLTGSADGTHSASVGIDGTGAATFPVFMGSATGDHTGVSDAARGSGSALLPPYRFRFPRRLELYPTPVRAALRASVSLAMRYGEQGAPFAIAATLTATPTLRIASGGALSLDVTSTGSMVLGMFALPVPALTAAMLSSARAFTLYGCESLPVMAFAVSEARMGQMLNAYPEDADGIVVRVTVPNVSASVGLTHRTWRHEVRAIP